MPSMVVTLKKPFPDAFGTKAYYHGVVCSRKSKKTGEMELAFGVEVVSKPGILYLVVAEELETVPFDC